MSITKALRVYKGHCMFFSSRCLIHAINVMKLVLAAIALLSFASIGLSDYVPGIVLSDKNQQIDRSKAIANKVEFAYIKATKGIREVNEAFPIQYTHAADIGLIRGAYHIAVPNMSSGALQAEFFLYHGARWVPNGYNLPGALKLEKSPFGNGCYGLPPGQMVSWIGEFSNVYRSRTGRFPVIYTTTDWWRTCTGNNPVFGATHPLWISQLSSSHGILPNGWRHYVLLHLDDNGPNYGFQDIFNGPRSYLEIFARSSQ